MVNNGLRQSTTQLLRSIIIMVQSLDRLPADCFLTMKLLYYDDITPEDYEPPGFEAADKDSFTFRGKPISISAGQVVTPFHSLKVKIRTNQEQFQDFASSPDSETHESRDKSQELADVCDDCTPLAIDEDIADENQCVPHNRGKCGNRSTTDASKLSDKSVAKDATDDWLQIKPQTYGSNSKQQKQQSVESKVISKIQDLKVADDSCKRKLDFEVTQDSVFNSRPYDKRFKASQASETLPLKNRH
jgi:hypothetical protein